jgi:uncharacterized GH25 family protein
MVSRQIIFSNLYFKLLGDTMKRIKILLTLCALTAIAYGHFPWIHSEGFTLSPNSRLRMYVGWGHGFPFGSFMDSSEISGLKITGPSGEVPAGFDNTHRFAAEERVKEEGVYLLEAVRPASYYSKTTQGGQRGSREDLTDFHVKSCTYTHSFMKAIVNVGAARADVNQPLGHDFEVIPGENPLNVGVGGELPVKVLLKGEPVEASVHATHVGHSSAVDDGEWVFEGTTDTGGNARIPLSSPGVWLVEVVYSRDYPDQDVCDTERFRSVLTFGLPAEK